MKKTLSQTNKDLDLRRFGKDVYSKALGEGEGGEITADDITPELLENGEILRKIQNWGLSDEEIARLPRVLFTINSEYDEDLIHYGTVLSATVDESTEYDFSEDSANIVNFVDDVLTEPYIFYSNNSIETIGSADSIVLKREVIQEGPYFEIVLYNIDKTIQINFSRNENNVYANTSIGISTL